MFKLFFSYLNNTVFATRDNIFSPIWFKDISDSELYLLPDDLYFLNKMFKPINYEKKNNYIILEVYYSIKELEDDIEIYKFFVKKIKDKYDLDVIFFPFDIQYGGEKQGKYLYSKIEELEYFSIHNNKFVKIEDTLGIVKNATLILCNRYHLFVFAIANNVPVIQILKNVLENKTYYYTKSKGVLDQVFKNQYYEEELFLSLSVSDCFNDVINNLENIVDNQNKLFNKQKKENEKMMLRRRNEFLEMIKNQ